MKTWIFCGAALLAGALMANPARAECSHCVVQTKTPSAAAPGKFDYRVSCIIDISGDEVNTVVIAGSDDEALSMARAGHC